MRGAEPGRDLGAEIGGEELLQHPFQVRHGDIAVNRQAFDLMEHRRMGLVVIGAIDPAGADHPARRAMGLHMPDLHRRSMGAQHMRRAVIPLAPMGIERVHLGPRRVVAGDVQRVEVVPIGLNLRPFGHGEAHIGENRGDFFGDLADRMDRALPPVSRRQGHVEPFALQPLVQSCIAQRRLFRSQSAVHLVFQRIQRRAGHLPLLGCHLTQFAHLQADLALLAQRGHPHLFKGRLIRRPRNALKPTAPQRVQPVHLRSPYPFGCQLSQHPSITSRAPKPENEKAPLPDQPATGPKALLRRTRRLERGLGLGHNGPKRLGFMHGQIGQNLTVHFDPGQ